MEHRYLEVMERKQTITSLELLEQINFFRKQEENKTELGHNDLLKIIRNEFEEEIHEGKISQMFYDLEIGNRAKRKSPMFILTLSQSKQVLMRESKFVRKAVINYIEKLELELQKPLTTEDLIILQAESIKDMKGRVDVLEDKVNNRMTIESGEQTSLQFKIKARVYERFDTYDKEELKKEIVKLLFSNIHKELKKKFGVPSYKDIKVKDFEDCLNFVKVWREDQSVGEKINEL